MQTEATDALFTRDLVSVEDLVMRKAELRLGRLADDVVAFDEGAGIVAEGEAGGVSMIASPLTPAASERRSSAMELQSVPAPSS